VNPAQLRRAMGAGIVFVVLFVVGFILTAADTPETKSSETSAAQAHKWVAELSSSSHRTGLIIGGYLLVVGALAWIWFTLGVRAWLAPDVLAGRAISSLGVLGAAAMGAAAMMGTAVAGSVEFGNEVVPQNGDVIRIVMGMFFPFLFVVFALAAAALIAVAALSGRRSGVLPRWLGWTAVVAVVAAVISVIGIPLVITLLWLLALAIVGLLRASSAADAPGATPAPPSPVTA
jgi:hypothetical protein